MEELNLGVLVMPSLQQEIISMHLSLLLTQMTTMVRKHLRKIYKFLSESADATHHCMVGFKIENTLSLNGSVARGLCEVTDGYLTDIEEHSDVIRESDGVIRATSSKGVRHDVPDGQSVSMNLWGFGAEFLEVMKAGFPAALDKIMEQNPLKGEYFLPYCIDTEVKAGRATVAVLQSSDKWFGVTYKEDKDEVDHEVFRDES